MSDAPAPPTEATLLRSHGPALLPAVASGLAVLCACTAMSGMIVGIGWFLHLVLVVAVVVSVGLLLRTVRWASRTPYATAVIALAQVAAAACLAASLFTSSAVLSVLPGPTALGDLAGLLSRSIAEIRVGRPPIPATPALSCLLVCALGLVAIVVDLLVVAIGAPAVAGLVLLCVYAVPASLADDMLVWWSFVLGAGAFAFVLAVDRVEKQQRWCGTGRVNGLRAVSTPLVLSTAVAIVAALIAGASLTSVGTTGRLPGGLDPAADGPMGIDPFTKLAGVLDQRSQPKELFRVTGLPANAPYLQAVTLSAFDRSTGWSVQKKLPPGEPVRGVLRLPPGTPDGQSTTIKVQPTGWRDNWLPLFGVARQVFDVPADVWRYDRESSTAFSVQLQTPGTYEEIANLGTPTRRQLQASAGGTAGLTDGASYTSALPTDPKVAALARQLTRGEHTTFDRARKLFTWFTRDGGFTYSDHTIGTPSNDPVADFVLRGKTGFCEQYASAMAVMLRSLSIPTRVAVGFTGGSDKGSYRSITTKDAHAWVQVYFPEHGWQSFDPTPLAGGSTFTPQYLQSAQDNRLPEPSAGPQPSERPESISPAPSTGQKQPADHRFPQQRAEQQHWWPPFQTAFTLDAPPAALWTLGLLVTIAAGSTMALRRSRHAAPQRSNHTDTDGR